MLETAIDRGGHSTSPETTELCLVWMESYLARLAQDGWIPGMSTPTYDRMLAVSVGAARRGVRDVRRSISVQTPFSYNHLLAIMVHVDNLTAALIGGAVIGATLGKIEEGSCGLEHAIESIIISLFMFTVSPFLYQAFLIIGAAMADPFDQDGAANTPILPMKRLVEKLQVELAVINDFVERPPNWAPPSFKT